MCHASSAWASTAPGFYACSCESTSVLLPRWLAIHNQACAIVVHMYAAPFNVLNHAMHALVHIPLSAHIACMHGVRVHR